MDPSVGMPALVAATPMAEEPVARFRCNDTFVVAAGIARHAKDRVICAEIIEVVGRKELIVAAAAAETNHRLAVRCGAGRYIRRRADNSVGMAAISRLV